MGMGWNVLQILSLLMLTATWTLCLVDGWMLVREVMKFARLEPERITTQTNESQRTS